MPRSNDRISTNVTPLDVKADEVIKAVRGYLRDLASSKSTSQLFQSRNAKSGSFLREVIKMQDDR